MSRLGSIIGSRYWVNILDCEPIIGYNRLMRQYNWQLPDWPNFQYDLGSFQDVLLAIAEKSGFLRGAQLNIDEYQSQEILIQALVEEAAKTSEIEGEYINRVDIHSSILKHLGLAVGDTPGVHDRRAQGVVDMMFAVRKTYFEPLTDAHLLNWHLMLLSSTPNPHLRVGYWRTDPSAMQIVSGHHGKWIIHFEAPPASQIPSQMASFIQWFNDTAPDQSRYMAHAPIRAAIAHLYFESLHPFDDGNGRIGRAIAEKALYQGYRSPLSLSLSQIIEANKKNYYAALKKASYSNDITQWLDYFLNVILKAHEMAIYYIKFVLAKSEFYKNFESLLNERQLKVVSRMFREGPKGFEGGMSAQKYMKITDTSKATATRDLQHMLQLGAILPSGSGRSVRYQLNLGLDEVNAQDE